uniref:Aquaporin n=1 Tax=Strongyloides venezuelensis TaxID=75913 RepID=A0A0K0FHT4_STRVS
MDVLILKPAVVCILFYITCFGLGELGRKIVSRFFQPASYPYIFLIEAIGTLQMCTCVYENGLMVKNYGPMGFFFTVTSLLCFANSWNRGAFVSPLAPFEMFFYKSINLGKFLAVVFGQILGGGYAFFSAKLLWYYTKNYSEEHQFALETFEKCVFNFKVSYVFVLLFEAIGCFCIRFIISKLPEKSKSFAIPITVAGFLTLGIVYIGVGGLNPTVAGSRLFGCSGLDTLWFAITYWIAPLIGWMSAAHLIHTGLLKSGGKRSKSSRKPSTVLKDNKSNNNKSSKKGKKKKEN